MKDGAAVLEFRWHNEQEREWAQTTFTEQCKLVSDAEKWASIAELAEKAGVEIPQSPPPRYAPMSWDDVRRCERMEMTFGPHTVTHPVLSRVTSGQAVQEITESWARLTVEARNPVPVFCYPNGGWDDFGAREIAVLREGGFLGAVVGEPGYADARAFRYSQDDRFRVQRFDFPDDLSHMIQYVSGVERIKQVLRRVR